MNYRWIPVVLLLWMAWFSTGPTVVAQPAGQPIALFNGYSLEGWTKANGQPHDGWVVDQGALHRKAGGGDLYHAGLHRDFILHFQWKISKGGNSGLKYRVRKYGNQRLGCEYQILDDQNAKERNKAASLYDVYETTPAKPEVHPDVWYQSKIVVCQNRIEHWLNGVLVVQADVGGDEWNERVGKSKFRGHEGFGANREGQIFLQDHGNPVWFRHIVLVPLNCDAAVASAGCDPGCGCDGYGQATTVSSHTECCSRSRLGVRRARRTTPCRVPRRTLFSRRR